ncbi:transmembrane amino acid transporter protein-domain-containing protein [Aspergillus caelatus]|uniref:Transmembrane amino acid transporter protein-domain-containing protein n=1 Tax=Aspergillus caelatus TaxID=61420 RepID=A0A5N7AKS8_9EURO|nr:transmembrane amino acid transporter protein-domain-containing protein [Aspergillus caelatus]KAE8370451.1 transmembrane amino acid transporter protein-domain-containing protein [Aspergillus caelatus]
MSKEKSDLDPEAIEPTPVSDDQVVAGKPIAHDDVFGEITENGPNYRDVGWMGTTALMMKTQIGLGVLSMPQIFDSLGIMPGIILLLAIAVITTWADWMVGVFKLRHPHVYGVDDVGRLLFGRVGYEVFGASFCLLYTFVSGSAILSISIALNALSTHAVCTAVFVAIAAVVGFMFSSIQTLGRISWLAWVGALCIIISVFVVTIAVGIQGHPPVTSETAGMIVKSDYKIIANPTFTKAISAVSTLVFTYSGTPAFFSIVAEMREPRLYTRSLLVCQFTVTTVYIVIGVVVYYYCGSYVASPALGSAGATVKKVSYGIALPGLIVSAVLFLHLSAKHIFVRILRGSRHLSSHTPIHWVTWLGSTFTVTLCAYLIASGVPVFSSLVSLIGALLGTLLTFQSTGCMWLYDNWKRSVEERSFTWKVGVAWSIFIVLAGTFLLIAGTYGSIVDIMDSYKESGGSAAWSCADNSGS